jgi:hypothetical protein
MAAVRAYVGHQLVPWVRYVYDVGTLAGLVVPRSMSWARRRWTSRHA